MTDVPPRMTSATSWAKKYSEPSSRRGASPTRLCRSASVFSSCGREVFFHRPRSTCGVAMMVSIPSSADMRQRSTASATVRGPSSTPGRQWWWMSITRLSAFQLALVRRLVVVVVVVALLVGVAVLVQVEVVEDRAEDGDVALAEPLG